MGAFLDGLNTGSVAGYTLATTGLPPTSGTYSVCGWIKVTTFATGILNPLWALINTIPTGAFATHNIVGINGASATAGTVVFTSQGTGLVSLSAASAIAANRWLFLAMSVDAAFNVTVYWKLPGGGLSSAQTTGDNFTPLGLCWGTSGNGATGFDATTGVIARCRVWLGILSRADFEVESRFKRARRRGDLFAEWQFRTDTDLIDSVRGTAVIAPSPTDNKPADDPPLGACFPAFVRFPFAGSASAFTAFQDEPAVSRYKSTYPIKNLMAQEQVLGPLAAAALGSIGWMTDDSWRPSQRIVVVVDSGGSGATAVQVGGLPAEDAAVRGKSTAPAWRSMFAAADVLFDATKPLATLFGHDELRPRPAPLPRVHDAALLNAKGVSVTLFDDAARPPLKTAPVMQDAQALDAASTALTSIGWLQGDIKTASTRPAWSQDAQAFDALATTALSSVGWMLGEFRPAPTRPSRPDDVWQASDTKPLPTISWGEDTSSPQWRRARSFGLATFEDETIKDLALNTLNAFGYAKDDVSPKRWRAQIFDEAWPLTATQPLGAGWYDERQSTVILKPPRMLDDAVLGPSFVRPNALPDDVAVRYYQPKRAPDEGLMLAKSSAALPSMASVPGDQTAQRKMPPWRTEDPFPGQSFKPLPSIGWSVPFEPIPPKYVYRAPDDTPPLRPVFLVHLPSLGWVEEIQPRWTRGRLPITKPEDETLGPMILVPVILGRPFVTLPSTLVITITSPTTHP